VVVGDASAALGAPEIMGTFVSPKGLTKKLAASTAGGIVGGALGGAVVGAAPGGARSGAGDLPDFGRVGYISVTANEVALVKTKTGMIKMKFSEEVLDKAQRSALSLAQFHVGTLLSHLTFESRMGSRGSLTCQRPTRRRLKRSSSRHSAARFAETRTINRITYEVVTPRAITSLSAIGSDLF
jgi:hypothetical protein